MPWSLQACRVSISSTLMLPMSLTNALHSESSGGAAPAWSVRVSVDAFLLSRAVHRREASA